MLKKLVILQATLNLLLFSCKTTSELEIKTTPDKSKVYAVDETGNKSLIGETPALISTEDRLFRNSSVARISVEKDGFKAESFVINKNKIPAKDTLIVSLKSNQEDNEQKENKCEIVSQENMNTLASGIAIVQAQITKKEYDVALIKLADLSVNYPNISVVWDLLGNVYYIQKKYESALDSYKRSLAIDPTNASTATMVRRLEEILGRRG